MLLVIVIPILHTKTLWSEVIPAGDFSVKKGDTVSSLNESLNLGFSSWRYKMYVRFFAPKVIIKAGEYQTEKDLPLSEFLQTGLRETKVVDNEQKIVLLPGWNLWDYDEYFSRSGILEKWEFIKTAKNNFSEYQKKYKFLSEAKSLEWFLMPDTYRIFKNATADDIIVKLLNAFDTNISDEFNALNSKKAYQTLILASILEREEKSKQNRPTVAGILQKRVHEGIAMGADATVCYGFQKTFKECTPSFIASVISDHSNEYNTRKTLWYPPTPISSVSISAWNAALNPKNSEYYYYLHDNNGQIHYAKNLSEHNANVQKYLR